MWITWIAIHTTGDISLLEEGFVPFLKKTCNESQVVNWRKKDHDYESGLNNGFTHHKNG